MFGGGSSSSLGAWTERANYIGGVGLQQESGEGPPSVVIPHENSASHGSSLLRASAARHSGTCVAVVDNRSSVVGRDIIPSVDGGVSSSGGGTNVFRVSSPEEIPMDVDQNVDTALTTSSSTQLGRTMAQNVHLLDFHTVLKTVPEDADDFYRIKTARRIIRTTNPISVPTVLQEAKLSEAAREYVQRGLFVAKKNKRQRMGRREREARRVDKERNDEWYRGVNAS